MKASELIAHAARADYFDPNTWEVFVQKGQALTPSHIERLERLGLAQTESQLHPPPLPPPPPPVAPVRHRFKGSYKHPRATAVLETAPGSITVNGAPLWDFFAGKSPAIQDYLHQFFDLREVKSALARTSIVVIVARSSGVTIHHAKAVVYSIARALMNSDIRFESVCRKYGIAGLRPTTGDRL